jgi:hypothetical protein
MTSAATFVTGLTGWPCSSKAFVTKGMTTLLRIGTDSVSMNTCARCSLGRDDDVGVCGLDLVVPRLNQRFRVGGVAEVADRAHVLSEDRQRPVPQVDDLGVEGRVPGGLLGQPGHDAIGGPVGARAAHDDNTMTSSFDIDDPYSVTGEASVLHGTP